MSPDRLLCQKTKYSLRVTTSFTGIFRSLIPVVHIFEGRSRSSLQAFQRCDVGALPLISPSLSAVRCPDTSLLRINRFPYNGGIPVRVTHLRFLPDCSQVMASLPCCSLAPPGNSLKTLCIGSPVLFLALAFYNSVLL